MGTGSTRYGFLGTGSEASTYNGSRGPSHRFNGQMDEIRIWSVARSQTDIQNNMNLCLSGSETGLDLYYPMDDGPGSSTINDLAGTNTGNLQNMSAANDWVTIVHDYSCPACESTRASALVQVNNTNSLSISGANSSSCIGAIPTLDAGTGFDSYSWNTGETSQTISTAISGTYYVDVLLGVCAASDTVSISLEGHSAQNCIDLDGVNDFAAIDNFYYKSTTITELSVEAWIRTTNAGDQIIASFDRSEYWRLGTNGDGAGAGRVSWNLRTNAGFLDMGSSTRVDDGNWHHITGTYNNGLASIYIDGELDATMSLGATVGTEEQDMVLLVWALKPQPITDQEDHQIILKEK